MTDEQMMAAAMLLLHDQRYDGSSSRDDIVPLQLERAKSAIVSHIWPYDHSKTWEDVPERHHPLAVDITVYLVNRMGAEGETSHAESGTSRGYESAGIPASYFRGVVPHAGVPS